MVVFAGSIVHPLLGNDAIQINTSTSASGIFTDLSTTNFTSQNSSIGSVNSTSLANSGTITTQNLSVINSATINNLTVNGVMTSVNSTNVEILDKIITLGKTSTSISSDHISGIEFDRGLSLNKYYLVYQESDQTIRAGVQNDTMPLMVRENIPNNLGFFVWDAGSYKAISKNSTESRLLLDVYNKGEINSSLLLKSDTTHNHNDLYWTKAEMNSSLLLKSDTTHNHNDIYYTEVEINNLLSSKLDLPTNPIDNGFFMWNTLTSTALTRNSTDSRNYLNVFSKNEILDYLAGKLNISTTTDLIAEGSQLYFTNARARLAISSTSPISYNNSTGVIGFSGITTSSVTEGTNLYYTDSRARNAFTAGTGISITNNGVITNTYQLPSNITLEGITITSYYRNFRNNQDWYVGIGAGDGGNNYNFLKAGFGTVLSLNENGNISIGGITPTEKLHIGGNLKVNGKIINHSPSNSGIITFFLIVDSSGVLTPVNMSLPSGFSIYTQSSNFQELYREKTIIFNIPSWGVIDPNFINQENIPCLATVFNDGFSSEYDNIIRTTCRVVSSERRIHCKIFTSVVFASTGQRVGASLACSVIITVPNEMC